MISKTEIVKCLYDHKKHIEAFHKRIKKLELAVKALEDNPRSEP